MAPEDGPLRELARSSRLSRAEVHRLVDLEVIAIGRGFADPALRRRLRRVRRLRRDLGLSLDAIAIVIRLLDRIEALERSAAQR